MPLSKSAMEEVDGYCECIFKKKKKRGLDIRQTSRMVGICEGECMGPSTWDEPLTLMRCHSCRLPWLYEALEGWKSICGQVYKLNA